MRVFPLAPAACALAAVLASACAAQGGGRSGLASAPAALDWRQLATDSDRFRLRQWRNAWMRALAEARTGGHAADVAKEGALLQPDAAIEWRTPPMGEYDCRVIKLGTKGAAGLPYVAYPPFRCRIRDEGGMTSFAKLSGSQRPLGLLVPARGGDRMVFLGTLQLGDETRALQYGRDRERDMAGFLDRIGPNRWRLAFPQPHFESKMDVMELVPRE
ncbi:DUF4893 domain-containing protein [Allosphingosinicella indica]|uniref:DUF4893 domain-containing protein n=1 Tax=Allosphingosinicella indica TaxID=941907 RepID=A0A1X7GF87_9SPHN|nr:DUF4893 domain-containing protein [Allosphingosinicella indica]SMF68888.1 protein of unknown function [Allosphingosinicella indica]